MDSARHHALDSEPAASAGPELREVEPRHDVTTHRPPDVVQPEPARRPLLHHVPPLHLLHIIKTAGTSVRIWLSELFAADAVWDRHHLWDMQRADSEELRRQQLIAGHFGWLGVERIEGAESGHQTITFLREPVSLLRSCLSFSLQLSDDDMAASSPDDPSQVAYRDMRAAEHSGDVDWDAQWDNEVSRQLMRDHFDNIQVRFLAGHGTQDPRAVAMTREHLDLAKARLAQLPFFGLMEDMAWSAALFAKAFDLPLRPIDLKWNVQAQNAPVSPRLRSFLNEHCELDLELYAYAVALFEQRVATWRWRMGLQPGAEPTDLADDLKQGFLSRGHELKGLASPSGRCSQGDGFIAEGFEPRFLHEGVGRWVRWAKPGPRSSLHLPLEPGPERRFHFEVPFACNLAIRDGLQVSISGRKLDMTRSFERWSDDVYAMLCEAVIPEDALDPAQQYVQIDFVVPREAQAGLPANLQGSGLFTLADFWLAPAAPVPPVNECDRCGPAIR